ncbi:hypothetical protein [Mesobacillus zeae]|uniref:hypothetical protein n=1 Tax=Mesobacillus zeae TaxID=1917180 RepID=UPI00300BD61E
MDDKKIVNDLKEIVIAALLSEGDFDSYSSKSNILKVPFDKKKSLYLAELISCSNLKPYINIDLKKGQFNIHSHQVLETLRNQWFRKQTKVFSTVLDPGLLSLQSIILSINLFGTRKVGSISIPTNIDKDFLRAVCYCMEYHLKVPVIPSVNHIKITNIPKLILNSMAFLPAIHSAEFVNFLTVKEKKQIMGEAII